MRACLRLSSAGVKTRWSHLELLLTSMLVIPRRILRPTDGLFGMFADCSSNTAGCNLKQSTEVMVICEEKQLSTYGDGGRRMVMGWVDKGSCCSACSPCCTVSLSESALLSRPGCDSSPQHDSKQCSAVGQHSSTCSMRWSSGAQHTRLSRWSGRAGPHRVGSGR